MRSSISERRNRSGPTIKVGTFAPFSGPMALRENGARMFAGAAAWLDLFNARGGLHGAPVELLAADNAYDVGQTVEVVRELMGAGVLALLNASGTPHLTAALPDLDAQGLPALLPFGGADEWFAPPRWGLLSVNAPFPDVGWLLGRWAAAAAGRKRVAIFHPDYPEVSVQMAEVASNSFETATGGAGAAPLVRVPLGCVDGVAMADALEAVGADAIIVLTNWPELLAALRELKRRGSAPPTYSWTANVTQEVARMGADVLEGAEGYSSLLVGPESDVPAVRAYREAMDRLFPSQAPDFLSLHAFAQTMVFTRALELAAKPLTSASLVEAFYALDGFETGILPPVRFTPDRHMGIDQVQPMRLVGGIWQPSGAPHTLGHASG